MADIAMCHDDECPVCDRCYRHEAPKSEFQWYGPHKHTSENGCEEFKPYVKPGTQCVTCGSYMIAPRSDNRRRGYVCGDCGRTFG